MLGINEILNKINAHSSLQTKINISDEQKIGKNKKTRSWLTSSFRNHYNFYFESVIIRKTTKMCPT